MLFNNPTMTTAVNTTANANVREITLTTKILNPKTKEDGTITGLLLFNKATDYHQIAALQVVPLCTTVQRDQEAGRCLLDEFSRCFWGCQSVLHSLTVHVGYGSV